MTLYAAEHPRSRSSSPETEAAERGRARWPWIWAALSCLLVAGSGLTRGWQERRFAVAQVATVTPSFPLTEIPKQLGPWRVREGGQVTLDPQVARVAGSTDSLVRTYEDESTGVFLTLLVLYGGAEKVSGHTAEVCYPAAGYEATPDVGDVPIKAGPIAATFRSLVFTRKGASVDREEVFYAFRQNGAWTPNVQGNWKSLSLESSLFKVQIQRRVAELEQRHLDNPTQAFLAKLLPELEKRIASGAAAKTAPAAPKGDAQ
jgi:Protein of unknown function (DUF3485)